MCFFLSVEFVRTAYRLDVIEFLTKFNSVNWVRLKSPISNCAVCLPVEKCFLYVKRYPRKFYVFVFLDKLFLDLCFWIACRNVHLNLKLPRIQSRHFIIKKNLQGLRLVAIWSYIDDINQVGKNKHFMLDTTSPSLLLL